MVGSPAAAPGRRSLARHPATWVLVAGIIACVGVAVAQAPTDRAGHSSLSIALAIAAILSGIVVVPTLGQASISAGFVVLLLAAGFLGPSAACACAALSELAAAWRLKTPPYAIAFNFLGSAVPAMLAANLIHAVTPHVSNSAGFYLMIAAG